MSQFIVFAGPNGSGKSSIRDAIANPVEVVIDPDRIARQINPTDPRSADLAAGRAAINLFEETIASGKSVSMETTLTGRSAIRRMQMAKAEGYEVSLIYVALDHQELNVARVASRARQGGHAIDPDTIRRRVGNSLENLPAALAIADQAIVLDNTGQEHRRLLELADGRITYLIEPLPDWLRERMPAIGAELLRDIAKGAAMGWPKPAEDTRRSLTTLLMEALRGPEGTPPPPWSPVPIPMAERIRAFEQQALQAKLEVIAKPVPEPEADAVPPGAKPNPRP